MSENSNHNADMHGEEEVNENSRIVDGSNENNIVFERLTDKRYIKLQKKLQWWSPNNTRMIVYLAFFLVLMLFSAYYFSVADYFVATLAAVAGLFMIYLTLSGAGYFGTALSADENLEEKRVALKICDKELFVEIDDKCESLTIATIKEVRINKNYIYFILKGSALCPCGITFELNGNYKKSDLKKLARKK